jgi:hypothetical protein
MFRTLPERMELTYRVKTHRQDSLKNWSLPMLHPQPLRIALVLLASISSAGFSAGVALAASPSQEFCTKMLLTGNWSAYRNKSDPYSYIAHCSRPRDVAEEGASVSPKLNVCVFKGTWTGPVEHELNGGGGRPTTSPGDEYYLVLRADLSQAEPTYGGSERFRVDKDFFKNNPNGKVGTDYKDPYSIYAVEGKNWAAFIRTDHNLGKERDHTNQTLEVTSGGVFQFRSLRREFKYPDIGSLKFTTSIRVLEGFTLDCRR